MFLIQREILCTGNLVQRNRVQFLAAHRFGQGEFAPIMRGVEAERYGSDVERIKRTADRDAIIIACTHHHSNRTLAAERAAGGGETKTLPTSRSGNPGISGSESGILRRGCEGRNAAKCTEGDRRVGAHAHNVRRCANGWGQHKASHGDRRACQCNISPIHTHDANLFPTDLFEVLHAKRPDR